jgi:hypothetical protein
MDVKMKSDPSSIPSGHAVNTISSYDFPFYCRILEKDENNIDAWQILAVHELVKEGNTDRVSCLKTQKLSLGTHL